MLELNWLSLLLIALDSGGKDGFREVKLFVVDSEAVVWGGEGVCV